MRRIFSPLLKFRCAAALHLALISSGFSGTQLDSLERDFVNPPDSSRPWVWGHWLHGNVDKACITRELEAMKRAGLGGVTLFDVAQPGIPAGPHSYMSASWQELFAWQITEAKRIGLEVMTQNGPGYSGNGGPWITPELASQKIVESATRIRGGRLFSGNLPQPATQGTFYKDVAVLAIRETKAQSEFRTEDFDMKRLVWLNYIRWKGTRSAPLHASAPAEICIPLDSIINLTSSMRPNCNITWNAPPGEWTLLRIGHTWTGQKTLPATPEGEGPECDKLDKRGIRAHFDHVMKRMIQLAGPEAGKTFHTFFVDSWEAGGQNWTQTMPEEFKRRRGYDITPYLPALSGRVIGNLQTTERFLYDLRQTVSELVTENFWAEMQSLCHAHGMRLAVQPYITTGNDLDAANFTDEPMGEFWSHPFQPNDYRTTIKAAASTANLNGKPIVGAEAFTASETERWLSHPATMKALGDQAFCLGANRFQFHRFAMQRFPQLKPGMTMGKWGQHYDSTQTWWNKSKPWHDYLARCQHLLRQGPVVTDVLALTSEEPLHRFEHKPISGHDYDACGPDTFRRIVTHDGQVGIPGGTQYPLITVSHGGTMTLERLRKIRDLVKAGASMLGEPPLATPGLQDAHQADAELRVLSEEIWGTRNESDRKLGQGRVFRNIPTEEALKRLKILPDFTAPEGITWIHRTAGDADIYFVASSADHPVVVPCTFRVTGKHAELWNPETGETRPLLTSPSGDARCHAHVPLGPDGSAFIVFRPGQAPLPSVSQISLNGEKIYPKQVLPSATADRLNTSFTYALWAKPSAEIELPVEANSGFSGLSHLRNDAIYPPPAHQILGTQDAFSGLSIGTNGAVVYEHAGSYFAPVLVHAATITNWTHIAISYQNGTPTLFINGKPTHTGLKGPFTIHCPVGVPFTTNTPYKGLLGKPDAFKIPMNEKQLKDWLAATKPNPDTAHEPAATIGSNGSIRLHRSGSYQVDFSDGQIRTLENITVPAPREIKGPWTLRFPADSPNPASLKLDSLISWSAHPDPALKHFSGTALYSSSFEITDAPSRVTLDLGRVEIIAELKINGKSLGILWKPPYQVDITSAVIVGKNQLEISVVNLWINRLIGDQALPEDSERDSKGLLLAWPEWAIQGKTSPTGRASFVTFPLWKKNETLRNSGLLGPVVLRFSQD